MNRESLRMHRAQPLLRLGSVVVAEFRAGIRGRGEMKGSELGAYGKVGCSGLIPHPGTTLHVLPLLLLRVHYCVIPLALP